MQTRPKRPAAVWLVLILFLAWSLRLYRLGVQSLWNDEGTSVAMAQRDLITIARDAAQDIHPPLYYWLLSGWVRLVGVREFAVRSLSALLGVVLVALTCAISWRLVGRWAGLVAAFLAAIHPFQVYYSQEARMYMLLAVISAGAILALICLGEQASFRTFWGLILLETAGLYTHYSFIFVVLVLNLAQVLRWGLSPRGPSLRRQVPNWGLVQGAVVLLYLPWLSTASRQIGAWPRPAQPAQVWPAVGHTWRWMLFGPVTETGSVTVPLFLAALAIGAGLLCLQRGWMGKTAADWSWGIGLLILWIGLPVLLMFALTLYREAYLKFLLVTTPAIGLLLACGLLGSPSAMPRLALYGWRCGQLVLFLGIGWANGSVLGSYYTDPAWARDDYRGIAAYIEAMGRPGDAVLLNAPGQQEVFGYYYRGDLPVYPLPESRPLDPTATEATMQELAEPGRHLFAVLWATDESDPERFIEGWLDSHTYKALDSWYGNVRLVLYAVPERIPTAPERHVGASLQNAETGDTVTLVGYSRPTDQVTAGDVAQITLFWQAERTPVRRYKVFIHLLDGVNHVISQRDAEPGGGVRLTTLWTAGEIVADHYGLPIHPATPPGTYRLEVGMYDGETGQRLSTPEGESQVWLELLTIERPPEPAPIAILGMQHPQGADMGELTLLGYDLYRLGFAHQPEMSLRPGDLAQVNLYWRAWAHPTGRWQIEIALLDADGHEQTKLVAEPVEGYPTSQWREGDVWRGQFHLPIPNGIPRGRYRVRVQALPPEGPAPAPFQTEPFMVDRSVGD